MSMSNLYHVTDYIYIEHESPFPYLSLVNNGHSKEELNEVVHVIWKTKNATWYVIQKCKRN